MSKVVSTVQWAKYLAVCLLSWLGTEAFSQDRQPAGATARGPQPGDVYREFALHNGGNRDWRVTDPQATASGAQQFLPNPILRLTVDDLEHAIRAEALVDRWGGHLRTTGKRIRFNDHAWILLPELQAIPAGRKPEYFYSQDNVTVDVPLAHLSEGINTIEGTCGTLEDYDWGQWGLYSLILRVYYDPSAKRHATGQITSPRAGDELSEKPEIIVGSQSLPGVARIDLLAWYDGYDENGDGVFRDWHAAYFQPLRGASADIREHVGTLWRAPYRITWDTRWVPDQPPNGVKLVARIQDDDGLWFVTDIVDNLSLVRPSESVRLYLAEEIPDGFGVRIGQEKSCTFRIPRRSEQEESQEAAQEAVLALRTWHGWDGHHEPIQFNDHRLRIDGKNHHYDFDLLPIPVAALERAANIFTVRSQTDHHMLEVLWPGPALIVRYRGPPAQVEARPADGELEVRRATKRAAYEQHALTHAGDGRRGRELFVDEQKANCISCHKVGGTGGEAGPDLSPIGGKFDRPHLIESLLEPSRQIVEGFRTTVITTTDGRVETGVVGEESQGSIDLFDARGHKHVVPKSDIDQRATSPVSLMPQGLIDLLTAEQFADLVAYLETLRTGDKPTPGSEASGPITLPRGFKVRTIATGLTGCTALETTSDGRVLVCEQTGALRVVQQGALLDEPLVSLDVDSTWERGLIGVTVHPEFPSVPYVYVCYVAKEPFPHHRISRFTVAGNVASVESEQRLLSGDDQRKLGGQVPAGHQGGALHFGPDGRLYIGIGEQTAGLPSQDLHSFQGKILRINPDGTVPADNPFVGSTTGKYQAIWALGLRNPFTFAFRDSGGELFINDVGGKFEEINRGVAGANYGWPVVEHGPTSRPLFESPLHFYPPASINGADFLPPDSSWPEPYRGRYFFADFVHGWIKTLEPDGDARVETFVTGLGRPVDLRFAKDGSVLYVLLRNAWVIDDKFQPGTGSLLQIRPRE